MGPGHLQAIAEILLAIVALGAILIHFGRKDQGAADLHRRVEKLEDTVDDHSVTVSKLDKGLALLNQSLGQLNETLASFPCRVPQASGHHRVSDCRDFEGDH